MVITPVPFDGTTCYRPGAREGAQAIITASRNLEMYDPELRRSPYTVGIHTLRPVEIINGDADAMVARTEWVTGKLLDAGKFVVTLGGDHLTSIGVIRAFARRHALPFPLLSDPDGAVARSSRAANCGIVPALSCRASQRM